MTVRTPAPAVSADTSRDKTLSSLYRRIGQRSRISGLAFVALTMGLLILSAYHPNIIIEIDSIVSFLAAVILLVKDPRSRVQTRVLDAIVLSSDQAIAELSAQSGVSYTYLPTGNSVLDVFMVPTPAGNGATPASDPAEEVTVKLTPPGRGLAVLFKREAGLAQITMDALTVSLPSVMRENFGLADSVDIDGNGESIVVTLSNPTATCDCGRNMPRDGSKGYIGCTVASFLAVLFSTATRRQVTLERCVHDSDAETWRISMNLGAAYRRDGE